MAIGEDYSEQPDQTGDANDTGARRRMMEFILRSAMKPSLPPMENGQISGNRQPGQQPGIAPSPDSPDHPGDPKAAGATDKPHEFRPPVSSTSSSNLPLGAGRFADSRPSIPAPTATDATAPNINSPFAPPPSNGKRVLGLPAPGAQVLGLNRVAQPTRPDVQPMRSDFPEKKLPTWEKVLGVAAAPFAPALSAAIFTSPRRGAERQYEEAAQDWKLGQEGQERQARIEETRARTKGLLNPQPKEGTTPEETTLADLMTGNNGQPQINPDTGKPYTRLEAFRTVETAKTGAAQGAKQPPLSPDNISQINQMHGQRYQVLNPDKPLPAALTLRPGATQADYERIDRNLTQMESAQGTQAQREATNASREQARQDRERDRQAKQSEKDSQSVIAFDPKTKQRILTTAGEAKQNGFTVATKATQADEEKAGEFNAQANDVQMNASRYRAALNALQGNISKESGEAMTRILSDASLNGFLTQGASLGALMDQISQGEKAKAWNKLSPAEQNALIGYLRMKGAAIAYQKMLTNQGRTSKEGLDIELANIPPPIMGATAANKQLDAFQENIDTAAQRAVRLPWMETPSDVRARIEKQAVSQYNQEQAGKQLGAYKGTGKEREGQGIQLPHVPGLSRVRKVYPDGSFDADQNP